MATTDIRIRIERQQLVEHITENPGKTLQALEKKFPTWQMSRRIQVLAEIGAVRLEPSFRTFSRQVRVFPLEGQAAAPEATA